MRVLVAPNAFKGCLSAREAALIIVRGLRRARPGVLVDPMPVSDGGDGLVEVLLERRGGRRVRVRVLDALGRPAWASYALLSDGRSAVVEMAQASGMARLKGRLDPLGATTYGTGQLIADALRRGRRRILVGMGGSAASDGGAGMAQALGARLLDERGRELPRGASALLRLARVEPPSLPAGARVLAVSDVRNPLLGPRGSARVYGPQKGAAPAQVRVLERALARWARALRRDLGVSTARLPGAGAAGGLGAGLAAFLGARLIPGADWVLAELGAAARVRRAGLVVTGEGRLDRQSLFGKAPVALARRARRAGVPVVFLCGSVEPGMGPALRRLGARAVELSRPGESPARAMRRVRQRLADLDWHGLLPWN